MKMAEQLIESLGAEFDIRKYKDDYREQVLAWLERKAEGEESCGGARRGAPGQGRQPHGGAARRAWRRRGREEVAGRSMDEARDRGRSGTGPDRSSAPPNRAGGIRPARLRSEKRKSG